MNILLIPTKYPNKYNLQSNLFFKDQAETIALKHTVVVMAINPISILEILKKRLFNIGYRHHSINNIPVYEFNFIAAPKSFKINQFLRKQITKYLLKKIFVNNLKIDICHVHTYEAAISAQQIKNKLNIPYVITEHSTSFARNTMTKSRMQSAKVAFLESKKNYAVSNQFCDLLRELFNKEFYYMPNVVDTDSFKSTREKRDHSLPFQLISIGYLQEKKQQIFLLELAEKLVKMNINFNIKIVGSGPLKMFLSNKIVEKNLEYQVELMGKLPREEVIYLLSKADLFLLPSLIETFGVVLIEAMSMGLPVVATKSGGPESIVVNDKLGMLTKNNSKEFGEATIKCLSNLKSYDSDYIKNYTVETFSKASICDKLTIEYETLVN